MRSLVAIVAASALATACQSDPCAIDRIPDCPGCGPGEPRRGLTADTAARVAGISAGGVALACGDVRTFDRELAELDRVDVAADQVATAPTGEIYAVAIDGDSLELVAIDATGAVRWRKSIGVTAAYVAIASLAAGEDGPYLSFDGTEAQIGEQVITGEATVGFDRDGAVRWIRPSDGGRRVTDVVIADGLGGSYLAADGEPGRASIHRLAADGTAVWRVDLVGPSNLARGVEVTAAVRAPDGGVVATGSFLGERLDLPGVTLDALPDAIETGFVVRLAADGAPAWAVALDSSSARPSAIALVGDEAIVAGEYGGTFDGLPNPTERDGFVAVVAPTGALRTLALGGSGVQRAIDVIATGSVELWVGIASEVGDTGPGRIQIGPWETSAGYALVALEL